MKHATPSIVITTIIVLALGLLPLLSLSTPAAGATTAAPESIEQPTWQAGDQWSMGYRMNSDDILSGIYDEYPDASTQQLAQLLEDSFHYSGETGVYQTTTVAETDAQVDGVACYRVAYELYAGAGIEMKMNLDQETLDQFNQIVSSASGSGYDPGSESELDMFEYMNYEGNVWYETDTTGDIFYTKDALAIKKASFDMTMNSELRLKTSVKYSDTADTGMSGEMNMDMYQKFEDFKIAYDITFEPALDIFDFPINKYEYWSAESQATLTLRELRGTVSYDISGNVMGMNQQMSDSVDIAQGVTLPKTFGPVELDCSFSASDTAAVGLIDGSSEECIKIDGSSYFDTYTSWDDWDSDISYSSGYAPEFDDIEDIPNPITDITDGDQYFSASQHNIVSGTPGDSFSMVGDTSDMFATPMGDMDTSNAKMEPVTASTVKTFADQGRESYSSYKPKLDSEADDLPWFLVLIALAVIVVIIIVIVAVIVRSKRKRSSSDDGMDFQAPGPQPSPPYGTDPYAPGQATQPPQQPQQPYPQPSYPHPQPQQPQQPQRPQQSQDPYPAPNYQNPAQYEYRSGAQQPTQPQQPQQQQQQYDDNDNYW